MSQQLVTRLRNRENVKMWDRENKLYTQFQLNKAASFVCWERWVKVPGGKWINWNKYLSLRDVVKIASAFAKQSA